MFPAENNLKCEIALFGVIVCMYLLKMSVSNPCIFATVPGISTGNSICT